MRTSLGAKITMAHLVNPNDSFTIVDYLDQNSLNKNGFFSPNIQHNIHRLRLCTVSKTQSL